MHYKWAIFNSYVKLPEGNMDKHWILEYPILYGFWGTTYSRQMAAMKNHGGQSPGRKAAGMKS